MEDSPSRLARWMCHPLRFLFVAPCFRMGLPDPPRGGAHIPSLLSSAPLIPGRELSSLALYHTWHTFDRRQTPACRGCLDGRIKPHHRSRRVACAARRTLDQTNRSYLLLFELFSVSRLRVGNQGSEDQVCREMNFSPIPASNMYSKRDS